MIDPAGWEALRAVRLPRAPQQSAPDPDSLRVEAAIDALRDAGESDSRIASLLAEALEVTEQRSREIIAELRPLGA